MLEPGYYDIKTQPITRQEWEILHSDLQQCIMDSDVVLGHPVVTLWCGKVDPDTDAAVFETTVLNTNGGTNHAQVVGQYDTLEAALQGHEQACRNLRRPAPADA